MKLKAAKALNVEAIKGKHYQECLDNLVDATRSHKTALAKYNKQIGITKDFEYKC